ncbi:menaquinone biosynthetic enzyme MqnA/MqnD family protein [Desulforhopalus singaporensis]|uniref:Chorismate dehydratase n=1 Tax=Desulforhopalus singaporensis TaxID=91360 RepID=A0A1H0PCP6_9BACT|nr:menaquinone biosynthesis protein [Desulforhopalus singaporensis]SDP02475.1 chorismate dehydratase [Desulforhopalus singaporensis]
MENSQSFNVKIGMVSYLNTAPIHEKWKASVTCDNWQLVEACPADLNRKLAAGEVDMGFVSSFEYGKHPDDYKILADLSISANGPVGSIFLFSHVPIEQLDKAPVLLTEKSETSVHLVKIILEEFSKVKPVYSSGDVMAADKNEYRAVLAIGDEALKMAESSSYLYEFDLGDIWKKETGLPFVFAVCAVREGFCKEHPEALAKIHKELLRCRDEGKADLDTICTLCASRIPMAKKKCHQYLEGIEYDLSGPKRRALETFFKILIKRGDISPNSLPLKIYVDLNDCD